MSGDLTPTELRVKVAEALGYRYAMDREIGPLGWEDRNGVMVGDIPNFGAPDWSATGAVLDEIERRGWGCRVGQPVWIDGLYYDCTIYVGDDVVEEGDKCRHIAVCKAFLEAHARAKEPHDAR